MREHLLIITKICWSEQIRYFSKQS